MPCTVCSHSALETVEFRHPLFRHSDFSTIGKTGCIQRCTHCQSLSTGLDEPARVDIQRMFESPQYADVSTEMSHTFVVEGRSEPVTRACLQAELIGRLVGQKSGLEILDVGCYDGELLLELDKVCNSPRLHGLDVNEGLRASFPMSESFRFWCCSLKDVPGRFDVVTISSAIVYFDVVEFLSDVKRLLKPEGFLFIQSVDISRSPLAILMGDQQAHYTRGIMSNVLSHSGFDVEWISADWAQREMIGVSRRSTDTKGLQTDTSVYGALDYIEQMSRRIGQLRFESTNVGVLGTSAAAAFTDEILQAETAFFVDENPRRVGRMFRGKKVIHPNDLETGDSVILPYGPAAEGIRERFAASYPGVFLAV